MSLACDCLRSGQMYVEVLRICYLLSSKRGRALLLRALAKLEVPCMTRLWQP